MWGYCTLNALYNKLPQTIYTSYKLSNTENVLLFFIPQIRTNTQTCSVKYITFSYMRSICICLLWSPSILFFYFVFRNIFFYCLLIKQWCESNIFTAPPRVYFRKIKKTTKNETQTLDRVKIKYCNSENIIFRSG